MNATEQIPADQTERTHVKCDVLTCKQIRLEGTPNLTISSMAGASGLWIGCDGTRQGIAIYSRTNGETCIGLYGRDKKAIKFGLSIDKNDVARIQIVHDDGRVTFIDAEKLANLADSIGS